jgi:class 3 adenylate cyclase
MLREGHQSLGLENVFPSEQVVRIERTLRRTEALTAAQVTALPLFRSLFPEQTLTPGMLVEIATTNFVAVQVAKLDEVFRVLGDAGTYSLMQEFQRIVERQVLRRGGVVVDYSDGILLASFSEPVAALEMTRELIPALTAERSSWNWLLSGALHNGQALVTGDRNEVKYFGATVNRTRQLARVAIPGSLILSRAVWSDPGVVSFYAEQLQPFPNGDEFGQEALQQIAFPIS